MSAIQLAAVRDAGLSPRDSYDQALRRIATAKVLHNDSVIEAWLAKGANTIENDHGKPHALKVWRMGGYLTRMVGGFSPVDQWLILITCYGHDVGYATGDRTGHESRGGVMMRDRLLALGASELHAGMVHAMIARHRTDYVIEHGVVNRLHPMFLLADKFEEGNDRPCPTRRDELTRCVSSPGEMVQWLARERDEWAAGNANRRHLRVSCAFQFKPSVVVDSGLKAICYSVTLNERLATPEDLFSLHSRRYQACHVCAEEVGHQFRLQVNQTWYQWQSGGWTKLEDMVVDTEC